MTSPRQRYVAAALAALAFVAPVKFGTPVVLDSVQMLPGSAIEWLLFSWPIALLVILVGLTLGPVTALPRQPVSILVLVWLGTQALALPGSINWQTSAETVFFFAGCVLVYLVVARYGREPAAVNAVLIGLSLATLATILVALDQHFGGLEATRQFAIGNEPLMQRLASGRVFGTFVYPNTLAGFLVLAFAPVLAWIGGRSWPRQVRWAALISAAGMMSWGLLLTGSRGGLAAFVVVILTGALLLAKTRPQRLAGIGAAVLCMAAGAMLIGSRGAASLEARFDYWRGAVAVARDFPWLGTGPGTFGSIYPLYKTASTEEAELVHNAYLQMWSDSGVLAFLAFAALWGGGLWLAVRRARESGGEPVRVALAAALAGWVVHQGVDFNLHVPGTALPAFLLLGLAVAGQVTSAEKPVPSWRWTRLAVLGAGLAVVGWEGRLLLAKARLAGGDLVGAVRLVPNNADYWSALSRAAEEAANWPLAIQAAERAVELDRYRASRHWRLALAEARVHGWTERSAAQLREAVRLNPTKKQYREALAEVEEKLRQGPGALLLSAPQGEVAGFSIDSSRQEDYKPRSN